MIRKDILVLFGNRIKELRNEKNLSQSELADLGGFHKNYVGMIERGERNPSLLNIERFANAFQLKVSQLLNFT